MTCTWVQGNAVWVLRVGVQMRLVGQRSRAHMHKWRMVVALIVLTKGNKVDVREQVYVQKVCIYLVIAIGIAVQIIVAIYTSVVHIRPYAEDATKVLLELCPQAKTRFLSKGAQASAVHIAQIVLGHPVGAKFQKRGGTLCLQSCRQH